MERLLFGSLMMSMICFPVLKVFRITRVHFEETLPDRIRNVPLSTNSGQNSSSQLPQFNRTFAPYPCACLLPLDNGKNTEHSKLLPYDTNNFTDRNVLDVRIRLNRTLHLLTPFLQKLERTRTKMLDELSSSLDLDPSESHTLVQASNENYFKVRTSNSKLF